MDEALSADHGVRLEQVVAEFHRVTLEQGVSYILIGAYARNLFLRERSSATTQPRMTLDVDFAVLVDSWDDFFRLRNRLLGTGNFLQSKGSDKPHVLMFRGEIRIDIIPFGSLAQNDTLLCWPEEFHQEMNVSGLREALQTAMTAHLGDLQVPTITPEAFVVLKLFAWDDQPSREKDAQDLAFLLREYENLSGKQESLWDPNNIDLDHLLEAHDRRIVRLIGRNIARAFLPETRRKICSILTREVDGPSWRLAGQMSSRNRAEKAIIALGDLRDGILDLESPLNRACNR